MRDNLVRTALYACRTKIPTKSVIIKSIVAILISVCTRWSCREQTDTLPSHTPSLEATLLLPHTNFAPCHQQNSEETTLT